MADRVASKLRGKDEAEVKLPSAPVNSALETVFAAERHLVGRLPLPPGLSLFAVVMVYAATEHNKAGGFS